MLFNMVCTCNASLEAEFEDKSTVTWLIVQRFLNAHIKCGYVTPVVKEEVEPLKTVEVPMSEPEQE